MSAAPTIFFSYAWDDNQQQGERREAIVDDLYNCLLAEGYNLVRDKKDLEYKGLISDFIYRIGQGDIIIVAISKKYLRSTYCMFELYEISRNARFDKYSFMSRIVPLMVEPVDLARPSVMDELFTYWKGMYDEWLRLIDKWKDDLRLGQWNGFENVKNIRHHLGDIMHWLSDMNTKDKQLLSGNNFAIIREKIKQMIEAPVVHPLPAVGGEEIFAGKAPAEILNTYLSGHEEIYLRMIANKPQMNIELQDMAGKRLPAAAAITDWVAYNEKSALFLLGDPGSGKTFLLRYIASILSQKKDKVIPVFIQGAQLPDLKGKMKDELLAFSTPAVSPDQFHAFSKLGRIIFIIDGLDEVIRPGDTADGKFEAILKNISHALPEACRLILSCRKTVFDAAGEAIRKVFTRKYDNYTYDRTESAIYAALPMMEQSGSIYTILDLPVNSMVSYLANIAGPEALLKEQIHELLNRFPKVPVILRLLSVALPQFKYRGTNSFDVDELYELAIRTWLGREPYLPDNGIDKIMILLTSLPFYWLKVEKELDHFAPLLVHSGLWEKLPNGMYRWFHQSLAEYFLARKLFEEIVSFNANTLSRLDLIGGYNTNRFLVPMLRRRMRAGKKQTPGPLAFISAGSYNIFLHKTGWRKKTGYGHHPGFISKDGTGYVSDTEQIRPSGYVTPDVRLPEHMVTSLSWYDAVAYCLWSGKCLPDAATIASGSKDNALMRWVWCSDWHNETNAHIAIAQVTQQNAGYNYTSGANPDFRHPDIGLAVM